MRNYFKLSLTLVLILSASDAWAFTLISNEGRPAVWTGGATKFHFNTGTSGYFDGGVDASGTASDDFDPIRKSFQSWLNLPGLKLSATEEAASAQSPSAGDRSNTLMWVKSGWRSLSFKPPSNALAVTLLSFDSDTGAITDADIYFNSESFKWAVVDSPSETNYVDVQNIATHEIGHFFGLDHSSESLFEDQEELADATMYFASGSGETARRDLHSDDTLAIRALYGTESRGSPIISAVSISSKSSDSIVYKVTGSGFNEYTSFVLTKGSASESDIVSRYRSIISGSEALVEFETLGMSGGPAEIVVFNDPSKLSQFPVELDSVTFGATEAEGGGGGGCSLQVADSFSMGFVVLLFALSLVFYSLRHKNSSVHKLPRSRQRKIFEALGRNR